MAMLGSINGVLMEGLDGDRTWHLKDYVARGGYPVEAHPGKQDVPGRRDQRSQKSRSCAVVAAPASRPV
jgi:hypothetical protein